MHQNLAVILWQFNYGKNSFILLIPGFRKFSEPKPKEIDEPEAEKGPGHVLHAAHKPIQAGH